MQILKGSDQRGPEFNEYIYSKGTSYEHHDIDKVSRMRKACKDTANSNDYSGAAAELIEFRKKWVDKILNNYPPHFAINTKWADLVEREEDKIRWNPEALVILSQDSVRYYILERELDYAIIDYKGIEPQYRDHHCSQFKDLLKTALEEFSLLINASR
jgi:hypothetical protein